MTDAAMPKKPIRAILVTGASGAGRTTATRALEDIGFETIDNIPLSLLPRVFDGPASMPPLAIGIDVRNRDFSVDGVVSVLDRIAADSGIEAELLFLDCRPDVLLRRYSETRRRHPLAPSETPEIGIAREMELLVTIRERSEHLIDTSSMTPRALKAEIERRFARGGTSVMALSVESFSYKRGLPRGVDMIFDMRFLANPHWQEELRDLDGRAPAVAAYVEADPRFAGFFEKLSDLVLNLVPAYKAEGKTYLSLGLGCTGGQHRSVAVAERLAKTLAENGWQVSTRHRELERRDIQPLGVGKTG
ncbi:MAG: RNase adapter RapZ [Silicimonas sp.]|nr:RNase adapter RapZ [Silicimonas sp.]